MIVDLCKISKQATPPTPPPRDAAFVALGDPQRFPAMTAALVLGPRGLLREVLPGLRAAMNRSYTLDVSAPLLRTQGYVNGRWTSAASVFPVLDPATGLEIARVSDCGPGEAKQAVDAAYEAFQSWKQYTAKVCGDQTPLNSVIKTSVLSHNCAKTYIIPTTTHYYYIVESHI